MPFYIIAFRYYCTFAVLAFAVIVHSLLWHYDRGPTDSGPPDTGPTDSGPQDCGPTVNVCSVFQTGDRQSNLLSWKDRQSNLISKKKSFFGSFKMNLLPFLIHGSVLDFFKASNFFIWCLNWVLNAVSSLSIWSLKFPQKKKTKVWRIQIKHNRIKTPINFFVIFYVIFHGDKMIFF